MAEYCFECFKKYIDGFVTEKDVVLQEDFCIECGCRKPCVMSVTPRYIKKLDLVDVLSDLQDTTLPLSEE